MPRGTYHLAGRPEAFSCAPGPAGWRFVSAALDLACDTGFRPVRFAITGPGATQLRGGGLRLDDGAPVLVWARSDAVDDEKVSAAAGLLTASPGSLVALVRGVAAPGEGRASADVPALRVAPDASGARLVRLRVERLGAERHEAPRGALLDETWRLTDVDTADASELHVAGDVVLHATVGVLDDEVELADLDGPPSLVG